MFLLEDCKLDVQITNDFEVPLFADLPCHCVYEGDDALGHYMDEMID